MKNLFKLSLSFLLISSLISCSDDEGATEKGSANVYITDAPVDNAEINGVFVTIADIKIDGNSIEGFSEQTINLMAYQNGETKLLGTGEFNVASYSNIELVLNYATDANGNAPGCYVLTDGGKLDIASSAQATQSVLVSGAFDIVSNAASDVVIDFNLRKAIKQNEDGSSQKYTLVSQSALNAATRVVSEAKSGSIDGTFDGSIESGEKVIVYAYKKGAFDQSSEMQANDQGILFAKAVNSSEVKSGLSNSYTLSFLEEGEYELHFARYQENAEGEATFEAILDVESSGNVSVSNINISAGAKVSLNILMKGVIG